MAQGGTYLTQLNAFLPALSPPPSAAHSHSASRNHYHVKQSHPFSPSFFQMLASCFKSVCCLTPALSVLYGLKRND